MTLPIQETRTMKRMAFISTIFCCLAISAYAQQPNEERSAIASAATAMDAKAAPALEGRLLTQVLNGSDDSPVTNVKIAVKNITGNFYTYVSGWVTFYDASATRCGEGVFKIDALAPQETAEVDAPGLRLRCTPAQWRIVATNLMTRTVDIAKPAEVVAPVVEPVAVRPAPVNFIISIDGEEHPIQVNNPITLRLGNRNRKVVLKPIQ
jgi:hypothetical protein